jgi:hypothetical protein
MPLKGHLLYRGASKPETKPGAGRRCGTLKIIYQISLSAVQDPDAFEIFMRDRYFPAVHKGPTRTGQVTDLALWREVAETNERTHAFLVHVGFDGLPIGQIRVDDDEVQAAFDAFGATLTRIGAFDERLVWAGDAKS